MLCELNGHQVLDTVERSALNAVPAERHEQPLSKSCFSVVSAVLRAM